jgi:hypothetical protein
LGLRVDYMLNPRFPYNLFWVGTTNDVCWIFQGFPCKCRVLGCMVGLVFGLKGFPLLSFVCCWSQTLEKFPYRGPRVLGVMPAVEC